MSIPEPDTLDKPELDRKLVRVEAEVPEDGVESLLAYAAAIRGEPLPKTKDFKAFLTAAPGGDKFWDDVATSRDKRPARDIEL